MNLSYLKGAVIAVQDVIVYRDYIKIDRKSKPFEYEYQIPKSVANVTVSAFKNKVFTVISTGFWMAAMSKMHLSFEVMTPHGLGICIIHADDDFTLVIKPEINGSLQWQ